MSDSRVDPSAGGELSFAFVGDIFPARPLGAGHGEAFGGIKRLFAGVDVVMGNSETVYHSYEAPPVPDSGPFGTYAVCPPAVIDDLHDLGVSIVSTANNHCADYGEGGVIANIANLRAHHMPFAGTGATLAEATQATYLGAGPAHSTVALVATTLTAPAGDHRAGDPDGIVKGRPGTSVIRHDPIHVVPADVLDVIGGLGGDLNLGRFHRRAGNRVRVGGVTFERGDGYETRESLHVGDLQRTLTAVEDARAFADWVVLSVHAHERGESKDYPAPFTVDLAHAAIDKGADVVFCHGPHIDRGIEIYRGRPIFYALGNFVLHNEVIPHQPPDFAERFEAPADAGTAAMYDARITNYSGGRGPDPLEYRSVIATVAFRDGALHRVELHPVDLGEKRSRARRGTPEMAEEDLGALILTRLQQISAPYGTRIDIEDGVGVIRLGATD
ncbi:MAG: putative enzyme of poly-gamma-glutamate biosynthesis (Capsule formation) [Subtercola sp.]|nr:putative enzyme of poly-gamma-glutamate biosynthesis (Capsule formation) [Subtercola sp.]